MENYRNRTFHIQVIVKDLAACFLRHSVYSINNLFFPVSILFYVIVIPHWLQIKFDVHGCVSVSSQ